MSEQYVCTVCGFNMIGEAPDECPFCHVDRSKFLSAENCSNTHFVVENPVNSCVYRVGSTPKLGLEHAAYRVDTGDITFLIDCPCCFDESMEPVDVIAFTHPHFVGAANMYRDAFCCELWMHKKDATYPIISKLGFDNTFSDDFVESGLEAIHLGGHTPGYTVYIFEDVLFICDMFWIENGKMKYNPYSPDDEIKKAGQKLQYILKDRKISEVCGWNYVIEFGLWSGYFEKLLAD